MKLLVAISRILVGALFIFSGLIKLNDPIGFSFKLEEYFSVTVLNIPLLEPYALAIAIFVVIFEVLLGVFLLIGYKPKFTVWSLLAMIVFFTFLTFYSAYFNKVTDCGCFGDAIKLTPWESFTKDIILLFFIIILFLGVKHIKPIWNKFGVTIVSLLSFIFCLGFVFHVLMHLPVKDFRPYKIGDNITENMIIPDDAPKAVVEYNWKFNIDGEEKIITTNGSYPTVKGKYVGVETEIIEEGYEAPIHDFSLERNGEDYTEALLNEENLIVFIAYNLARAEAEGLDKLKAVSNEAAKKGYKVIGLTASGPEEQLQISKKHGLNFDFYFCDETALKTIVRSNPGILELDKGTIKQKLHWNDLEDLKLESLPNAVPNLNVELKIKLDQILKLDQGIREVFSTQNEEKRNSIAREKGIPIQENFADYFPLSREIDSINIKAIDSIIKIHGYPGKDLVGKPTNSATFYVIQHSNKISKYLPLVKEAAKKGQLPLRLAAMMEDRNLMYNDEEQIYGTQGTTLRINTDNPISFIWPINDVENVNKRRKEVGFKSTIEDYAKDLYGEDFIFKNYTLEEVNTLKEN